LLLEAQASDANTTKEDGTTVGIQQNVTDQNSTSEATVKFDDQRAKVLDREIELAKIQVELQKDRNGAEIERMRINADLEKERIQLEMAKLNPGGSNGTRRNGNFDYVYGQLPQFDEANPESFFETFEDMASIKGWPEQKWHEFVPMKFVGRAQILYREIPMERRTDYDLVKDVVLSGYAGNSEAYRLEFRSLTKSNTENYVDYGYKLKLKYNRWLDTVDDKDDAEALKQLFLCEQFKECLPADILLYVTQSKCKTVFDMSKSADEFVALKKSAYKRNKFDSSNKSGNLNYYQRYGGNTGTNVNTGSGEARNRDTGTSYSNGYTSGHGVGAMNTGAQSQQSGTVSRQYSNSDKTGNSGPRPDNRCFVCKQEGHRKAQCPMRQKQFTAQVNLISQGTGVRSGDLAGGYLFDVPDEVVSSVKCPVVDDVVHPLFREHLCRGTLFAQDGDKLDFVALRDTAAVQTLISEERIPRKFFTETEQFRLIKGITSTVVEIPLVEIDLSIICDKINVSGKQLVGLMTSLPAGIDLLLANDMIQHSNCTPDIEVELEELMNESSDSEELTDASSKDLIKLKASDEVLDGLRDFEEFIVQSPNSLDDNVSKDVIVVTDHNNTDKVYDNLDVTVDKLIELQRNDVSLDQCFKVAYVADSSDAGNNENVLCGSMPNNHYEIDKDVLFHKLFDQNRNLFMRRVVLPKELIPEVLNCAHNVPSAGHMGIKKTLDRLKPHFFWPRQRKDVVRYCRSCDTCQRIGKQGVGKRRHRRGRGKTRSGLRLDGFLLSAGSAGRGLWPVRQLSPAQCRISGGRCP
jgi:hypothetical protein